MQGYCFNCKAQRNIAGATLFTAKNGQLMYEGSCHTCGLAMYMYPPAARQAQAVGDEGGRTSGRPKTRANAANYSQRAASIPTRRKTAPLSHATKMQMTAMAISTTVCIGLFLWFVIAQRNEGRAGSDYVLILIVLGFGWVILTGGFMFLLDPTGWANLGNQRQQAKQQRAQAHVAEHYSASPTATESQQVVEYQSYQEFDVDRPRWLANEWRVASIDDKPQRAGIKRVVALGFIGSLVWKPGAHVYVIYERDG